MITGTVTDRNDKPIENIVAILYQSDGNLWIEDTVLTDENGNYTIRLTVPGPNYRIGFDGISYHPELPYVTEYFDNVSDIESSQVFTFPAETTTPNINAKLDQYGTITGTVTGTNGEPLAGVFVQSYERATGMPMLSTTTDSSGSYSLGLEPGKEFSIGFSHPSHESEFYNNQTSVETGTPVTTPINSIVPNINAQLIPGPVISGIVKDNNGHPLTGIYVIAYDTAYSPNIKAMVQTDESGHYAIGLTTGIYRLGFNTSESEMQRASYVGEYYGNVASIVDATPIVLTLGNDLTINSELAIIPNISGRVSNTSGEPIVGEITVEMMKRVLIEGEWQWQCCSYSIPPILSLDGHYEIRNIEPGEYIVRFHAGEQYVAEYYPNQYMLANATIFTITDSSIITGVDAVMEQPGLIRGTVVDGANQPLPNVSVRLYTESYLNDQTEREPHQLQTDRNGHFSTSWGPNKIWMEFKDPFNRVAGEFYDNKSYLDSAIPVTVTPETMVTLSVKLERGASITGHVTGWNGEPLANVIVHVERYWAYWPYSINYPWEHMAQLGGSTDEHGNYRITGLTPGAKYRLYFLLKENDYTPPLSMVFYPNGSSTDAEQTIIIPTATTLPNVNVVMLLEGEVQAGFTGTPREGSSSITVNFTDQSLGTVKSRSWDFGDGTTSIQPNPSYTYSSPGNYTVSLTVTGTANSDVETKVGYIVVADTPITELSIQQPNSQQPKVGETIFFTATAAGSNVEYLWDFGDDTLAATSTASGQSAQHTYDAPGTYTITLTASNSQGQEQVTSQITVKHGGFLPQIAR